MRPCPAVRAKVRRLADRSASMNPAGFMRDPADMERIQIEQHSFMGTVWLAGWLFTIGFLQLLFWKGVLAILLWPYYLGVAFSGVVHR
jgi:hypothetical protein